MTAVKLGLKWQMKYQLYKLSHMFATCLLANTNCKMKDHVYECIKL